MDKENKSLEKTFDFPDVLALNPYPYWLPLPSSMLSFWHHIFHKWYGAHLNWVKNHT